PVKLDYKTVQQSGDTAVAGTDYTSVDTTQTANPLVIPADSTTAEIDVPILALLPGSADKTFHLQLVGADNAIVDQTPVLGTIHDQVPKSTISVADATFPNGGAGGNMQFTVSLNAPINHDVVVDVSTTQQQGDTAVAGTDFTAVTNKQVTI